MKGLKELFQLEHGSPSLNRTTPVAALHSYRWYLCFVLWLAYLLSSIDRFMMGVVIIPLKVEFHLSDAQFGMLTGLGFALLFGVPGVILGSWPMWATGAL